MEIGDIIKHTIITEVDGVVAANSYNYIVKDATLAGSLGELVLAVHLDYWTRIQAIVSNLVSSTCSSWENLSGSDAAITKFQTLPGTSVEDNMPSDNAVVLTKKAVRADGLIATGSVRLAGFQMSLQEGGHLDEYNAALLLKSWLTADFVSGPTILRNVQRGSILGEVQYSEVEQATTNAHVVKVPHRQSSLCAVA